MCSQLLGESSEANGGADDDDDDDGGGAAGATTEAAGASLRRSMPRVVTVTFEWSKDTRYHPDAAHCHLYRRRVAALDAVRRDRYV
jgi:hypothetical protein